MIDYLNGNHDARVKVESTTLEMWEMTGKTMFRTYRQMLPIEKKALGLCRGRILDIGAGSGCHSRHLQQKKKYVDALDYSPGCIETMKKRQVKNTIHDSLFSLESSRYDTLLLMMNGIGIVGSLDGLNLFFQFAKTILNRGGRIITDSTDLASLYDPETLPPDDPDQPYYGETTFTMTYKDIKSDPFDWLYVDFDTLAWHADFHGFRCEKIMKDNTGKYLARMHLL